ncbi:unnamed protein product [Prunus brigantina]
MQSIFFHPQCLLLSILLEIASCSLSKKRTTICRHILSFSHSSYFLHWFMPHTAAKLKFPYYWDEECLEVELPPKDEL